MRRRAALVVASRSISTASSGVWFGPAIAAKQRAPLANVGYAIAIMPRGSGEQNR